MAKHRSGRYIEGAINRQKVLDYLNANPGHNAVQIEQALKLRGAKRPAGAPC